MTPADNILLALSLGCFVVAGLLLLMIARDSLAKRKPPTDRKCPPFLNQIKP